MTKRWIEIGERMPSGSNEYLVLFQRGEGWWYKIVDFDVDVMDSFGRYARCWMELPPPDSIDYPRPDSDGGL